MDSKFMNSSVDESKIGNLIKLNSTVEDAIDDNDIPSSSSSSTDVLMTPISYPESENIAAVTPPTTDLAQAAAATSSPLVAPHSTKGSPVVVNAEESTTPKAALVVLARGSGSRRGGYGHNSRCHLGEWGSSRGELFVHSAPTGPAQAAALQPPLGNPGHAHPPATIPMCLPFLSHVGLPGDTIINDLDQLIGYVAQLVHMVEDHRSTIKSLTTENQSLHQSLLNALNKGPNSHEATFECENADILNRILDFQGSRIASQPSDHHQPVISRLSNSTEAQIFNALVTGTGLPGLSLNEVRGHGSDSDWLAGYSAASAPRVVVPHHYARPRPVELELTMITPQVSRPSARLVPAAPRYRGDTLGDFMGFGFPFQR